MDRTVPKSGVCVAGAFRIEANIALAFGWKRQAQRYRCNNVYGKSPLTNKDFLSHELQTENVLTAPKHGN